MSHLLGWGAQSQVITGARAVNLCHVSYHISVCSLSFLALSQSTPQIIINIINKNERQVIKCKICRVPPRTRRAVHKRDSLILLLIQAADEASPAHGLIEVVKEVGERDDYGGSSPVRRDWKGAPRLRWSPQSPPCCCSHPYQGPRNSKN